jgi:hypothetical protein
MEERDGDVEASCASEREERGRKVKGKLIPRLA